MKEREYELYGQTRQGKWTCYSINYSRGSHPWICRVTAKGVKQAYAKAYAGEGTLHLNHEDFYR